jgi:hypothetical protein
MQTVDSIIHETKKLLTSHFANVMSFRVERTADAKSDELIRSLLVAVTGYGNMFQVYKNYDHEGQYSVFIPSNTDPVAYMFMGSGLMNSTKVQNIATTIFVDVEFSDNNTQIQAFHVRAGEFVPYYVVPVLHDVVASIVAFKDGDATNVQIKRTLASANLSTTVKSEWVDAIGKGMNETPLWLLKNTVHQLYADMYGMSNHHYFTITVEKPDVWTTNDHRFRPNDSTNVASMFLKHIDKGHFRQWYSPLVVSHYGENAVGSIGVAYAAEGGFCFHGLSRCEANNFFENLGIHVSSRYDARPHGNNAGDDVFSRMHHVPPWAFDGFYCALRRFLQLSGRADDIKLSPLRVTSAYYQH